MIKHKRTIQLEKELCALSVDNELLATLLEYRTTLISIKALRKVVSCLPTFNAKS
jgi:hypothetical protein